MGNTNKNRKAANDGFAAPVKAKKSNKESKKGILTGICMVLVLALCLGVIAYTKIADSGYFYRNTVSVTSENYEVNNAMMSYFFNTQYQQMASSLESMGVDLTKNLKDQTYTADMTWYDYIMQNAAVPQVEQILVLCEAAKAAGYELSEEDHESIEHALEDLKTSMKDYSAQYGGTETYYLRNIYGYGIKYSDIRDAMELNQLAASYSQSVSDSFQYTDADWTTYLDEHRSEFLVVDYLSYTFEAAEAEKAEEETAAETEAATESKSEEEAALTPEKEEAKNKATALVQIMRSDIENAYIHFNNKVTEELQNVVYAEEEDETVKSEKVNSDLAATVNEAVANDATNEFMKYAFSEDRADDVYMTSDDNAGHYTVYLITKAPYIEEYTTKNVRMIALSAAEGEDVEGVLQNVLDEIEASDKTEAAFESIALKYSHDAAHSNGGLYENQPKGALGVDELDEWLYSSDRVAGDYTSVTTGDAENKVCYVAYYVGDGLVKWQSDVDSTMVSAAYAEEYEKFAEAHKVEADFNELYKIPSQAGI